MRSAWIGLALSLGLAAPAAAQAAEPRVVVSVNAGIQSAGSTLGDHFEFERNVETATVDVRYSKKPAVLFDGGVGFRVWKRIGIGVAGSRAVTNAAAHVDASIPHPLQFNQPRAISGDQPDVTRAETAAHVQLLYLMPASGRWSLTLAAGASFISVEQEVVTDVLYDETFPFDTATFRSAPTRRVKASAPGFNAGADVGWMFTRRIGAGLLLRFTNANVELDAAADRHLTIHAGGGQVGAGIRIVF